MGTSDVSLVLSYFSLGAVSFEQRVSAAAAGGFAGIGLWSADYSKSLAAGLRPGELRSIADDNGVRVTEVEVLSGWCSRDPGPEYEAGEAVLLEMAEVFGSRHLHVMGPRAGSLDDAAEAFAGVCDRAAERGLLVALEALPFTDIGDFGLALDIVDRAGRPNGGLCLDSWHHFRGANDIELLRAIPPSRIVSVQLSDGTAAPATDDYVADTISNRRPPGEGEFDLAGFLAEVTHKGFTSPMSVEVISSELALLDPAVAARRLGDATRALLAAS